MPLSGFSRMAFDVDHDMSFWYRRGLALLALGVGLGIRSLPAQVLTLEEARIRAIKTSPELNAAREGIVASAGRERQAGAFPNPILTYSREQTSRAGRTSWQNIGLVEQRLDFGGQRGARRVAAAHRREAATARARSLESDLLFEVTRAYALAVAADRRAERAGQAAAAFDRARRISRERLAHGDVSGYADRRIGLEAARYSTLRAEALLARRSARLVLGALLTGSADSLAVLEQPLEDSLALPQLNLSVDSLRALALVSRPELLSADAEVAAAGADARAFRREAFPTPTAGIGFKNEKGAGDPSAASGFVLQLSLPVPLWDGKRAGSQAFEAEARQRTAEAGGLRRRVVQEVEQAWAGVRATEEQLEPLRPQLGREARAALTAAEAAYAEGEISLVEWLDAVRAYQEAEASFASLEADYVIQRAALERAVGTRLN